MTPPKPANDGPAYREGDMFVWCDCGKGTFWIAQDPETGWWHIICTKCQADHSMWLVG